MANFCRFCGSALEEGQVCACQANQAAPEAAPVATAAPAAAPKGNFLVDTLKAYWKAPKATAAEVAGSDKAATIAGIFAGVNVLAVFAFLWRIIGMLLDGIADKGGVDVSDLEDLMELEYPIVPMLIAGLGIAVLGILLTALVVFVAGKINKQNVDLKQQIMVAAINSIIPSAILVVGIALGFITWWLQFAILGLVLVVWFINVVNAIREDAGVQALESGKTLTIQSVVIFAVLAVVVYAMVSIGGWGVGELSIQGMTLNEVIEKAGGVLEMLGSGMF